MNRSFRKLMLTLLLVLVFILSFGAMSLFNATDGTMQIPDGNPTTNPYDNLTMEEIVVNQGYSGACGDNVEWSYSSYTGILTISGEGEMYDYYYGTEAPWYHLKESIEEIVVKYGVTKIGSCAFEGIDYVMSITVAESVEIIGERAFHFAITASSAKITIYSPACEIFDDNGTLGCRNISGYPGSTTEAFANSYNKTFIPLELPSLNGNCGIAGDNVKWYRLRDTVYIYGKGEMFDYDYLKEGDTALVSPFTGMDCEKVVIGEGITNIGIGVFALCVNLESIEISSTVENIEPYAFYGCYSLEEITIPSNIKKIGESAFGECINLESVVLNDGVKHIGPNAFEYCEKINSIIIPDSTIHISENFSDSLFYKNPDNWENGGLYVGNHLIKVDPSFSGNFVVKSGTLTIADRAFSDCENITDFNAPDSLVYAGLNNNYSDMNFYRDSTKWDKGALYLGKCLIALDDSVTGEFTAKEGTVSVSLDSNKISLKNVSLIIPEGVRYLGDFYGMNGLVSISISSTVEYIGGYYFYYCESLSSIYVHEDNPYFSSDENGVLFNKDKTVLLSYPMNNQLNSYSVPEGVIKLEEMSLAQNAKLNNLTLPTSLQSIERYALYYLKLNNLTIPENVSFIGFMAAACSDELESLSIESKNTYIGTGAFAGCLSMKSVSISDHEMYISFDAFNNSFLTDKENWENGALYIGKHLIRVSEGEEDFVVKDGTLSIASGAFVDASNIKTITVPDSVKIVGAGAFVTRDDNVTEINLGNNIKNIYQYTFANKNVMIPEGVEFLYLTCVNSEQTETVSVPSTVKHIMPSAFESSALKEIVVDSANEHFINDKSGVLYSKDKTKLVAYPAGRAEKSYLIPDQTTKIGLGSFTSTTSLTSVIIPESVKLIEYSAFYGCDNITDVYYCGTEEEWEKIEIQMLNDPILNANIHFIQGAGSWENITWLLDNGILYIEGEGEIPDGFTFDEETGDFIYDEETGEPIRTVPWANYINDIRMVIIGEGITSIGKGTFHSHFNLIDVELPSTLQKIDWAAFVDCVKLENINLPDGIKTISGNPFHETSIKNITLPTDLIELNGYSEEYLFNFDMCIYLESLTIPGSVGNVKAIVTPGCSSLRNIYNRSMDALIEFDEYGFGYWYGDEATAELMTISMSAAYDSIANPELTEEELQAIVSERLIEKYGSLENAPQPVLTDTVGQYITVYCYKNSVQHLYCVENGINFVLIDEHSHIDTDSDKICDVCGIVYMCGDNLFWLFDDSDGTLTVSGEGDMYNFESSTVPWKDYLEDIKTVVIQDGATSVGEVAFMNCKNLLTVYLADSVISLNDDCFSRCTSLETVNMSKNIETIGSYAFYCCSNLKSLELPDGLTTIGFAAIQSCEKINYIEIPASVTEIGTSAFARMYELVQFNVAEDNEYYSSLDGVLFDKNKTIIVEYPCAGPIENYIIPDSVKTIYGSTFRDIKKLKTVVIGNNVENIAGADVFADSPSLTSVIILNPNITIYDSERTLSTDLTIYGHSGSTAEEYANKYSRDFVALESSDFSGSCGVADDNVKWSRLGDMLYIYGEGEMLNYKVNKYAPWYPYRDQITSVVVEEGVTSIGDLSFYKCNNITDIQLPDSVERIGKYAFNGCDSIVSMYIPSSVNTIDAKAFHSCNGLVEFIVSEDNQYFTSVDGVLFDKNVEELIKFPLAKEVTEYFAPDSIKSIGADSFNGCMYLTKISFYADTIKENAFYGCENLENVTIGGRVKTVEPYAFYNCKNLKELSIYSINLTIGDWAFYKCNNLETIEYKGSQAMWDEFDFGNDNKPLTKANVITGIYTSAVEPSNSVITFRKRVNPPIADEECKHNYETVVTAPTCSSKGFTTYTCSKCGNSYNGDETEALVHSYNAVITKATCEEGGFTTYTCSTCGDGYIADNTEAIGHCDENSDGKCDNCEFDFTDDCNCSCHSNGIKKLLYKLIRFFWRAFRVNNTCKCGVAHY